MPPNLNSFIYSPTNPPPIHPPTFPHSRTSPNDSPSNRCSKSCSIDWVAYRPDPGDGPMGNYHVQSSKLIDQEDLWKNLIGWRGFFQFLIGSEGLPGREQLSFRFSRNISKKNRKPNTGQNTLNNTINLLC